MLLSDKTYCSGSAQNQCHTFCSSTEQFRRLNRLPAIGYAPRFLGEGRLAVNPLANLVQVPWPAFLWLESLYQRNYPGIFQGESETDSDLSEPAPESLPPTRQS